MRRILSLILSVALVMSVVTPLTAAGAAVGHISGVARASSGQQLANQVARLRNLDIGHVADVTTTNASGQFSFERLTAGNYMVELVSNGFVVGTSAPVVLTTADMSEEGVAALAAGGAQAQAGALAGSFWASTAGIIVVAAVAAGVIIAVVVAQDEDESPTR